MQALAKVEIICYDRKIYVPQNMHTRVIYWYHLYLKHPGVSILEKHLGCILLEMPCNSSRDVWQAVQDVSTVKK